MTDATSRPLAFCAHPQQHVRHTTLHPDQNTNTTCRDICHVHRHSWRCVHRDESFLLNNRCHDPNTAPILSVLAMSSSSPIESVCAPSGFKSWPTVRHHHNPKCKIGQHFVWVMVVRCGEKSPHKPPIKGRSPRGARAPTPKSCSGLMMLKLSVGEDRQT